jgi:hypothetical protein
MSHVVPGPFPADEWRELLHALCADNASMVGTVGEGDGDSMASVGPTKFDWLTGFTWRPVGETFGIAILELAHPGTFAPDAWSPVCGPLVRGPNSRRGPVLQGLAEWPETGNRVAVYLTTDRPPDDPLARVTHVRIRIEPA